MHTGGAVAFGWGLGNEARWCSSLAENVGEETISPLPGVGVKDTIQVLLGYGLGGKYKDNTQTCTAAAASKQCGPAMCNCASLTHSKSNIINSHGCRVQQLT